MIQDCIRFDDDPNRFKKNSQKKPLQYQNYSFTKFESKKYRQNLIGYIYDTITLVYVLECVCSTFFQSKFKAIHQPNMK